MAVTKQRKILIVTATLGVSSLALDRLVLAPPDAASADQSEYLMSDEQADETGLGIQKDEQVNDKQPALPSFESLTQRLIASAGQHGNATASRHDPFALPEQWTPQRVVEVETPPEQTDTGAAAEQLLQQYKLDGTFRSVIDGKQEQLAVINGRSMRVGQVVKVELGPKSDGSGQRNEIYTLVKVGARAVIWESQHSERQVVMKAPAVLE